MKIKLKSGEFGWDYLLVNTETGKDILIQSDWDYPGIASAFGWVPCSQCSRTDGTVSCDHRTATEMILDAHDFLDSIADTDTQVNDPGYFTENAS